MRTTNIALRRGTRVALTVLGLTTAAPVLLAHDFWLVPNAFRFAPGAVMEVHGQTSAKFPTSQAAVPADRVADARLIAASGEERLTDLSIGGTSLVIRHKPTTAGQRVVAVALVARSARTTPERLARYIALEGAPELAQQLQRDGAFPKTDSVTQLSAKFAKTVVDVGQGGPRAYARAAGHALELVPVNDPSVLRAGDTLAVRLLFHGAPVPGAYLRAGSAPSADTPAPPDRKDAVIVTGADGVARVPLDAGGLWNVRSLHAAPTSSGDWEVYFATLVVDAAGGRTHGSSGGEVAPTPRPAPTPAARAASDSADAAGVVTRFHAALAAGDSAAALALLADDVVILESGGAQTRDEYRAHHLPADIGFARAVPSQQEPVRVRVRGDVAWASGTSTTQGEYRGRSINSAGAELMVLSRERDGWKIRAVHWSSRARRSP